MKRLLAALMILVASGLLYLQLDSAGESRALRFASEQVEPVGDQPAVLESEAASVSDPRSSADQREALETDEFSADEYVVYTVRVTIEDSGHVIGNSGSSRHVELGVALGSQAAMGTLRDEKVVLLETQVDDAHSRVVKLAVPRRFLGQAAAKNLRRPVLWGTVAETGYSRSVSTATLPEDPAELVEIVVRLSPGGTIYGRLLCADGSPAEKGRIILCSVTKEGQFDRTVQGKQVGREGYFTLHYSKRGRFAVHAMSEGLGAVTSEVLRLAHGEPIELELTLQGAGVIAGRVVGQDGEAFPKYSLQLLPVAANGMVGAVGGFKERVARQWDGGLTDALTRTDEDGLFRFGGLKSGRYEIRGLLPVSGTYGTVLTKEPVQTDALGLEFSMPGCRLLLHVLDSAGRSIKSLGLAHNSGDQLVRKHDLYCEPCDPSGVLLGRQASSGKGRARLENGAVVLDVEPGQSYVVGVVSKANHLEELVVHIPEGEARTERTLQLRALPVPTKFVVCVLTPDGKTFESSAVVRVFAPSSGRQLLELSGRRRGGKFEGKLGPGLYRLEVATTGQGVDDDGRRGPAPFAYTEELVRLFPGRENLFEVRLRAAGQLEISVASDVEWPPPLPPGRRAILPCSREHGIAVRLEPLGEGRAIRLLFDHFMRGSSLGSFRPADRPWTCIGRARVSTTPIPVGQYEIIIVGSGFHELRQQIVIEQGGVAKAKFTLTQEDLLK